MWVGGHVQGGGPSVSFRGHSEALASIAMLRHKVLTAHCCRSAHPGRGETRRHSRPRNTGSLMRAESELLPLLETLYNSKNPTRRWLHCTRRDWICGKLRACARQRPGSALEVGFGAGVYLPMLAELYGELVATAPNAAHLNPPPNLAPSSPNLRLVTH